MIYGGRCPVWAPVTTSSDRRGRRSYRGRPLPRRTSGRACGAIGGRHRTNDENYYVALVSARDPLKMVAVEPRLLSLHTIESYRTLERDHINDS